MESALSIKGQATIPKTVREHLHLEPGDRIKFFLHPDGSVVILPKLPTSALKGIVPRRRRPPTVVEMHKAIGAGAAGRPIRAKRA
jgi:antitoxin PrlF